jgi:hypothetical protein
MSVGTIYERGNDETIEFYAVVCPINKGRQEII